MSTLTGARMGRPAKHPLREIGPGERFGRLTVIRQLDGRSVYCLRCDCEAEIEEYRSKLLNGERKSCGCLTRELKDTLGERRHYSTPDWKPPERCVSPKCFEPAGHGGRERFCRFHAEWFARMREEIRQDQARLSRRDRRPDDELEMAA